MAEKRTFIVHGSGEDIQVTTAVQPKLPHTPKGPAPTIVVTEALINETKKRDSSHCMIAEAIKRTIPGVKRISVDLQTIRFTDGKKPLRYTYLTPRIAQVALVRFDRGDKTLGPFSFRLQGAHVTLTPLGRRLLSELEQRPKQPISDKKLASGRINIQKAHAVMKDRSLAALLNTDVRTDAGASRMVRRVGGHPPPMLGSKWKRKDPNSPVVPGMRREFGLRNLVR